MWFCKEEESVVKMSLKENLQSFREPQPSFLKRVEAFRHSSPSSNHKRDDSSCDQKTGSLRNHFMGLEGQRKSQLGANECWSFRTLRKMVFCFKKKCVLLGFLCCFCFLCVLMMSFLNGWPMPDQYSAYKPSRKNVTILLWHWPFGRSMSLKGDVCWDLYQIPRCTLVDQRSDFPAADVVVFHNKELIQGRQKLPTDLPRPPAQRWAWMSLESPVHNGNLQKFANVFNVTVSYRRDADITIPYGELLPVEPDEHLVEDNFVNKTSLVCWVVSNYMRHHKRNQVYKELKAIVPVKIYGRRTRTPLSAEELLPTISRCYFYLAFENSVAKDYITEKLWKNSYQGRAVPIVLGPPIRDYKEVAPNHSFIHVDQFASVKELGTHLQQLAKDKKRYAEYFDWKKHWKVKLYTDWRERLCKICLMYDRLPQHKVYSDLQGWFAKLTET